MKLHHYVLPVRRALLSLLLIAVCIQARADTLHILFIGNSHTYTNNLPQLFADLSQSAGRPVVFDMSAPSGYSLMEHATNESTLAKISRGGWDYVVLQEQSQIPTIPFWRDSGMFPAARFLDSLVTSHGGSTAFYMTWGWKLGGTMIYQGDTSPHFRDYFEMQDSVATTYVTIAGELSALLSPVGMAWRRARILDTLVDLWQEDCCHATLKGTYLAACVFYCAIFHDDPTGLLFFGGLSAEDAFFCQVVAWQTLTGVDEQHSKPRPVAMILQLAPNPFSEAVRITSRPGTDRIVIRDRAGRIVRELRTGSVRSTTWDGRDFRGARLPAGVYLLEARAGQLTARQKLVFLR